MTNKVTSTTTALPILDRTRLYIGGQWVDSGGSGRIEVVNPATEELIGEVAEGTAGDVDRAVLAARDAFPGWASLSGPERADYLQRTSDALAAKSEALGQLVSRDLGAPVDVATEVQIGLPIFNFGRFAELARTFDFDGPEVGNSLIVREPVGVVGCITPWNFPLHQVTLKVAAALAAGCTVVVKPSEVAPLAVWELAQIFDEIGLPPGVFNLVSGSGAVVGEAIARHPDIDMVSFTGSNAAGKRVAELALGTVKRVALELGGKSANIILDDADLEQAVTDGIGKCFFNSGQTCSALTRMIVPADRIEEVEEIVQRAAQQFQLGDPAEPGTPLGPVVSGTQRTRVQDYIRSGIAQGATLLVGGPDDDRAVGYFVQPTVFSRVTPEMTIAREEIFGPVLSILTSRDEDDAVRIANESDYGLAGGVWSGDPDRALRVARRLRTGQVEVNGAPFNPAAPFGGYKQSGYGREAGVFGLEEFLQTKAIQF